MHLNKVEIRFGMYQFHTLVVLLFTIVVTDPAPFGLEHSLPHLGSLTTQLLAQLISLLLRPFGYTKLQEDVLRLVELRHIFFHIRYSLGCVTSVLSHHGKVKQRPDTGERTSEALHLRTIRLSQRHSENSQQTTPEIPQLFCLPLLNLPVGHFGDKESRVRGQSFPGVVEGLLSHMVFEQSLNPVHHMLEES